ncbi:hypothetical protein AcidC75_33020 [Acidisoma sp. C75]
MKAQAAAQPGFYGKLPARGDFVGRGLSAATVATLDQWICRLMVGAQAQFGEGWAEAWAVMPAWHFALPAGACGPLQLHGVLGPSHDRVGRRFPLVLAVEGLVDPPGDAPDQAAALHAHLEDLCRAAIGDGWPPDRLAAELRRGALPPAAMVRAGRWWSLPCPPAPSRSFDSDTLPDEAHFLRMVGA